MARAATRRPAGSGAVWAYLTAIVVLSAAAMGCAYLLAERSPQAIGELSQEPEPLTSQVRASEVDYGQSATLTGVFMPGPPVLASGLSGTVTASNLTPGTRLTTGTELYRVDDRPVVAYVGEQVFFRPLGVGMEGPDVLAAQRLLNVVVDGAAIEEDGRFGISSLRAAQQYARDAGFGRQVAQFDPTWFARVPFDQYEVKTSTVTVGAAAPGAGEPIVATSDQLTSASVVASAESQDGEYVFVSETRQVPVVRSGGDWRVDDLPSATQVLPPAGDGGVASTEGRIRLAAPVPAQSVPAASIVPGVTEGEYCVFLASDDGYSSTRVRLAGAPAADQVFIEPSLTTGATLLVNPREVSPSATCP